MNGSGFGMGMLEGERGGVENHFRGGCGTIVNAQNRVATARRHRMKPEAFFVLMLGNEAFVGKGVFTEAHKITLMLEVHDPPVILGGARLLKLRQDHGNRRLRHRLRKPVGKGL